MKKTFMLLTALVAWCSSAWAEGLTVQNISIPQGGEATLEIALENATTEFAAFQFNLQLGNGITVALNNKGKLDFEKGERLDDDFTLSMSQPDPDVNSFRVLGYYTETQAISGTSGVIIKVTLKADASLTVGTDLDCKLTETNLTEPDETKHMPDDITFTVTIGEPADTRVILDEASTTVPSAATGVDVRVKRTIKANEWSTICLPFAMSTAQLDAAFGEMGTGWMLADFQGVESETDAGENVVGISINFGKATAIEANHPYLIKVSEAVSSFTVDGVEIDPEEEPSVDKDEYRTGAGTKKDPYVYHYNSFVGSYVKDTEVPELCLFLNGNKFYYSSGATKMKAFRGYFDFYDVLSEVENANSRVLLVWDGQATAIAEIDVPNVLKGAVYNLNGQFMGTDVDMKSLPQGVYTVDGKKVVNY